jgi:CBS domain-containing protein
MEKAKSLVAGRSLVFATPDMTVLDAATLMNKHKIGAVVVLEKGELRGIFSERDILNKVIVAGRDPRTTKVSEMMTRDVVVADASDTYEECLARMKKIGCRHLPIVEKDNLIGIVSIRDLLTHDIKVKSEEIKMMNYLYHYSPTNMEE